MTPQRNIMPNKKTLRFPAAFFCKRLLRSASITSN